MYSKPNLIRKKITGKKFPVCWQVIRATAITYGEVRNRIELKVPDHFEEVYGIAFGASTTGVAANSYILGNLTLHTNSKQSNPVNFPVQVIPFATNNKKYEVLTLQEKLKPGMKVQADYRDNQTLAVDATYTLIIYLKGKRKNAE